MSGRIWAALLFLCVCLELGGSSARLKRWKSEETMPSQSRSRRSWIWNQFFVIEEYSGPEPVLIGRLHSSVDRGDGRTKYILKGEGAGSVFVIDSRTGNIHVTKPLDREEKDQYRLIATATDRQTGRALEPSSQFIILVAALSLLLRRQKRDTQSPVEDDEIRENIITYDDEGGGEADTAAFDIATLKSAPQSIAVPAQSRPLTAGADSLTNRMGDFLQHRLALVTFDPMQPPYDSLQTYGLEGGGSQATSLSSLESEAEKDTEGQKHRFEEWGPKFDRLGNGSKEGGCDVTS
uniref:Cadherin-11-like n=1 Tax=Sinocyclocheilus rhinocerous TaxID=307959 RepID=A0A673GRR3_9TELE